MQGFNKITLNNRTQYINVAVLVSNVKLLKLFIHYLVLLFPKYLMLCISNMLFSKSTNEKKNIIELMHDLSSL